MPPQPQEETYIEITTPTEMERDLLLAMRSKMITLQRQQKIRLLRKKQQLIRQEVDKHLDKAQAYVKKAKSLLPPPPAEPKEKTTAEASESPMDELEQLIKQIDEKIQKLSSEKTR